MMKVPPTAHIVGNPALYALAGKLPASLAARLIINGAARLIISSMLELTINK